MEQIKKLQPTRTIHLRGFSDFGAAAALHSASEIGFKVSGVFRDAADFAVLVLWDRDDFFGHPRFSYLPDGDFSGIVLTFDLTYQNLQPIDSPKFATIDWPYLNCLKTDGTLKQIKLFDHATQVGGSYTAASGTFTLVDNGLQPYDRVTLWYQNWRSITSCQTRRPVYPPRASWPISATRSTTPTGRLSGCSSL